MERKLLAWALEQFDAGAPLAQWFLGEKARSLLKEECRENPTLPQLPFEASPKWVRRFMHRWNLVRRRATTTGSRIPGTRIELIQSWFDLISESRRLNQYKVYLSVDETPMYFDMPSKFTIALRGMKRIPVKTTGNEKNRFTLMLGVSSDGTKLIPVIILRSKGGLPAGFKQLDGVEVRVQAHGWMDEKGDSCCFHFFAPLICIQLSACE